MLSIIAMYACAHCVTILARRFSVRFNKPSTLVRGGQIARSQTVAEHRQRVVSVRNERPEIAKRNRAAQSGGSGHASDVALPLMERPIWCHHDHDDELGQFWYGDPPPTFPKSPEAADITAPVKAHTQDKPRRVAKCASADPPSKQSPVRSKTPDMTAPVKAHSEQDKRRPAGTSGSDDFRRPRDETYWNEAGNLLFEYFELQAGTLDSETLVDGFIGWLRCSPAEFRCYVEGDDMARAGLVDRYLKVVR
jgi:hypothetical protein